MIASPSYVSCIYTYYNIVILSEIRISVLSCNCFLISTRFFRVVYLASYKMYRQGTRYHLYNQRWHQFFQVSSDFIFFSDFVCNNVFMKFTGSLSA